MKISKSTAYKYSKNIKLNYEAKKRIEKLIINGRNKSIEINKNNKIQRTKKIEKNCVVLKNKKYNKNDLKLFLSLLYWGEGGKTENRVVFTNPDPKMIITSLLLFRSSFKINNDKLKVKLYLHDYHDKIEMLRFRSCVCNIDKKNFFIYNKIHTGINKKVGYKGCVSVCYHNVDIFKEIFIIINRFINYCGIS